MKSSMTIERVINKEYLNSYIRIVKCQICSNIINNPMDCDKCENSFCYECINNSLCPFNCIDFKIKPSSQGVKYILSSLIFKCINNCKEEIAYNDLTKHLTNCEKVNRNRNLNISQIMKQTEKECNKINKDTIKFKSQITSNMDNLFKNICEQKKLKNGNNFKIKCFEIQRMEGFSISRSYKGDKNISEIKVNDRLSEIVRILFEDYKRIENKISEVNLALNELKYNSDPSKMNLNRIDQGREKDGINFTSIEDIIADYSQKIENILSSLRIKNDNIEKILIIFTSNQLKWCASCENLSKGNSFLFCKECNFEKCKKCSNKCKNCNNLNCKSCLICEYCNKFNCKECKKKCSSCNKKFCSICIEKCESCFKDLCTKCLTKCLNCSKKNCVNCIQSCHKCESACCKKCKTYLGYIECFSCKQITCKNCCELCEICDLQVCINCKFSCTFCKRNGCQKNKIQCTSCGELHCKKCSIELQHIKCFKCESLFCTKCSGGDLINCTKCAQKFCRNCYTVCRKCKDNYCLNCKSRCDNCKDISCLKCNYSCACGEFKFCERCLFDIKPICSHDCVFFINDKSKFISSKTRSKLKLPSSFEAKFYIEKMNSKSLLIGLTDNADYEEDSVTFIDKVWVFKAATGEKYSSEKGIENYIKSAKEKDFLIITKLQNDLYFSINHQINSQIAYKLNKKKDYYIYLENDSTMVMEPTNVVFIYIRNIF